jgi:hypothetical protein
VSSKRVDARSGTVCLDAHYRRQDAFVDAVVAGEGIVHLNIVNDLIICRIFSLLYEDYKNQRFK